MRIWIRIRLKGKIRIRIRIPPKSWIRICFKVIRIRNPAPALSPPATVSWERRLCGFPITVYYC
jgi:hypothetical protein